MKKQMMAMRKRVLAMLLAVVMVVQGIGMAPLVARADEVMNENTSFDTAKDLTLDTATTVDIGVYEELYYQFTPSESGYYTFYSESEIDPWATLYDSDENWLTQNDDSGDSSDFSVTYNLEAGRKYYLQINLLSEDGGSLTIHVKEATFFAYADDSEVAIEYGETGILSVTAYSASGSLSYQWYYYDEETEDDISIPNANSSSYTVDTSVNSAQAYYCEVSDGNESCEVYIYVTLDTGLKLEEEEVYVTIPYEGKETLTVEASGGIGELSYEWYYFDEDEGYLQIENATGSNYEVEGTEDMPWEYMCEVTDGIVTKSCWFYTTLDTGLELKKTYESCTVIYGRKETLAVQASGGVGELTYQWYAYDEETDEYIEIEDATKGSYEVEGAKDIPTTYKCEVTDGIATQSCYFNVMVETGLMIQYDGMEQVIPEGATKMLSVRASSILEDFTYQWYEYDEEAGECSAIEGATEAGYGVSGNAQTAKMYQVEVSDGVETCWATISVKVVPVVEFDMAGENTLSNENFATTDKVVYKISMDEDGAYCFYSKSTEGGDPYAELWDSKAKELVANEDGNDLDFSLPYYLKAGETYYLVIGRHDTTASYTIQTKKVDFAAAAKGDNAVGLAMEETKTLEVEGYTENETLSYQWGYYESGVWVNIDNATQSSLEITGNEETQPYYLCRVSDGSNSTEVIFYVTLMTKLAAVSDYDGSVPYGGKTTLSVITTGGVGVISYQWYYEQDNQLFLIENATESTYEVSGTKDMLLHYYCEVSDSYSSVNAWYNLELDTGLEVTSNEGGYVKDYGDKVTFYARATGGEGDIRYQWYEQVDDEEGTYRAIVGATGSDLRCIVRGNASYKCSVTDGIATKDYYFTVWTEDTEDVADLATVAEAELEYESVAYDGTAKTPAVTVKDTGVTLYAGKDYTVEYTDNTNVGTAMVTITGMGDYTGTITKKFAIEAVSLSDAIVTLSTTSYTYDGTAKTPAVTVKCGSKVLVNGTDYTVSYSNNTNVGTATVTITGKGIYKGTITKNFVIKAAEKKAVSISGATVSLEKTSYNYDGKAKTPAVTVKVGSTVLVKDTDYTVSYANNSNIGNATVTITGKGNYTGTASATFKINAKKGSKFTVGSYKYTITGSDTVAFAGIKNDKTTKVSIAKTVKIGGKTFKITSIADKALYKKSKVTSVTVGANVTKIGKEAFRSCSKLKTITIKTQKLKSVGKNAFKGIKSTATIKVPSQKLRTYKNLLKGKGQSSKVKIKK